MPDFELAKTKTFKVSRLKEPEYNPNRMTDEEFQRLEASMEKFGVVELPVVNTRKGRVGVIVGGSHRVKALKLRGNVEVEGVVVNLDLLAEKELNLRLNKHRGSPVADVLREFFEPSELTEVGYSDLDLARWEMLGEEAAADLAAAADPEEMPPNMAAQKLRAIQEALGADSVDDAIKKASSEPAQELAKLRTALGASTTKRALEVAATLPPPSTAAMSPEDRTSAWGGMPTFDCADETPESTIMVSFSRSSDRQKFASAVGAPITDKTKSIWFPAVERVKFGEVS